MEKLFKPERFSTDPDCPTAQREWTQWIHNFRNFVDKVKIQDGNKSKTLSKDEKLKVLSNFLSSNVFEFINECDCYDAALATLETLYVKPENIVFARHQLSSRKQLSSESIDQYLAALRTLAKNCEFKTVTAEQNRNDYIRDAFIAGLLSPHIRQRLLENKTLELAQAEEQARLGKFITPSMNNFDV